ncbi:hypothetical protein K435DRAFT_775584 [Dendrothele bispora CBS 962.96]|uniref:F-box domain-containing protein n=1 Tax=Dendrothele bispora (strain CBS 962.96) TaxID=1314807 RepID=A0A4S8MIH8_DENBC|nr:hypothetical protein K435DRAFT_775584 [Dendrothele bispora CBS 962.96]
MSKHRLSPAPLPPAKRLHTSASISSHPLSRLPLTFDNALYDELILNIFSYLPWVDLCVSQATSKNWCRLASDNELWRTLFLKVYGRPRLRGARGFVARTDGREVKSLPGRAKTEILKDWKWMFRISYNWRKGRCAVEGLESVLPSTHLNQTHILLAGSLTVMSSSQETDSPEICLRTDAGASYQLACTPTRSGGPVRITTLALDQSAPTSCHIRVACFISSGEFAIFSTNHTEPSKSHRYLTYVPTRKNSRVSPIIHAVYHHPLLITLSEVFTLSVYDLSSDNAVLTQTLTSFTSYPPTSLVLSTPTASTYKLVLAYALPVYPAHWSVGVTELIIAGPASSTRASLPSSSSYLSPDVEPMTILSTRTARAIDVPQGWIDERKLRYMREQWSRRVARIADTQTDGKWVVLAPEDSGSRSESVTSNQEHASSLYTPTSLQLYRLSLPPTHSVSSSLPKLTFVRSLTGQLGPISALSLSDGRCVSFGLNGSIWVWDLEVGTGAEVAQPEEGGSFEKLDLTKRSVVFDERKIVTAVDSRIVVRRFDI